MGDSDGEPQRVVSVIALRIQREDDCLLVQLGKLKEGGFVPDCQLPGCKMEFEELPGDAMQRLVKKNLPSLAGRLQILSTDREISFALSKSSQLRTKYLRTVYRVRLNGQLDVETCQRKQMETRISNCSMTPVNSLGCCALDAVTDLKLDELSVYVVHGGKGTSAFYAWLSAEQYKFLNSKSST